MRLAERKKREMIRSCAQEPDHSQETIDGRTYRVGTAPYSSRADGSGMPQAIVEDLSPLRGFVGAFVGSSRTRNHTIVSEETFDFLAEYPTSGLGADPGCRR